MLASLRCSSETVSLCIEGIYGAVSCKCVRTTDQRGSKPLLVQMRRCVLEIDVDYDLRRLVSKGPNGLDARVTEYFEKWGITNYSMSIRGYTTRISYTVDDHEYHSTFDMSADLLRTSLIGIRDVLINDGGFKKSVDSLNFILKYTEVPDVDYKM